MTNERDIHRIISVIEPVVATYEPLNVAYFVIFDAHLEHPLKDFTVPQPSPDLGKTMFGIIFIEELNRRSYNHQSSPSSSSISSV